MTPPDLTREEMTRRMRGWSLRRAAAMLPEAEVHDAAQEAALAVWRASGRLREGVDPWPLLTMVARAAINRHAGRYYDRTPLPAEAEDVPSRYDTTEAVALDRVEHRAVWAAVAALSPRERDAVLMVDMLDVAPEEAARRLGLSPAAGALRQARRRAHAKLRVALADLVAA